MLRSTLMPGTSRQRRRLFAGSIMNFRMLSKETNNAVSMIDTWMLAGAEPARHVHEREDETFTIHTGEVAFFLGKTVTRAGKGDVIFAPRGVPHHFKILTPSCRVTLTFTPGNIDQYFWQSSFPFEEDEPPQGDLNSSREEIEGMKRLAERYGVNFL